MKLFERFFGNTARSRNEALIALKLGEIAKVQKAQAEDLLTIQARIDAIDNKVASLKRERKRIESEMATAGRLNEVEIKKLNTELAQLWAEKDGLDSASDVSVPAGQTLTIRTGEPDPKRTRPY